MTNCKISDLPCADEPQTFEELIARLEKIKGKTLGEIALLNGAYVPESTVHAKGFAGELIERVLGASAKNQSVPDFQILGVELKTIPVDYSLSPLESTFVSHAPLTGVRNLSFENSTLYAKIKRVLFIPIVAPRELSIEKRTVAGYFFYTPSMDDLKILKEDFDELYEMVKTGHADEINARIGQIVQMRPKGADGRSLTQCTGPDGNTILTRPRGFYIRRSFTKQLIMRYISQ